VLVGVGEQEDGFVGVVDVGAGEAGLVGDDQLDLIFAGDVGGGDDDEFVPGDAGVVVNCLDEAAGNRAADGCAVPEAFAVDVVDVFCAAKDLVHALFAELRGADYAGFGARTHAVSVCGPSAAWAKDA